MFSFHKFKVLALWAAVCMSMLSEDQESAEILPLEEDTAFCVLPRKLMVFEKSMEEHSDVDPATESADEVAPAQ